MEKRTLILGEYNTAAHGLWTLSSWTLEEPELLTNLQPVPGRIKGPLDLSTALTDGLPSYGPRSLSAVLESSEGDRLAREGRISHMINQLHGQRVDIVLPDHPGRYAVGRLSVSRLYNDLAHGSVQVSAVCEPWLYAAAETVVTLKAATAEQTAQLYNLGAMPVVPVLDITAATGESVVLSFGSSSLSLSAGSYEWPELFLTPGVHSLVYSGAGTVRITWREGVLR